MKNNIIDDAVLDKVTGGSDEPKPSYASYFSVQVTYGATGTFFHFTAFDLPFISYSIECPNGDKISHEEIDYFKKLEFRGYGEYRITLELYDGPVISVIFSFPAKTFVDA